MSAYIMGRLVIVLSCRVGSLNKIQTLASSSCTHIQPGSDGRHISKTHENDTKVQDSLIDQSEAFDNVVSLTNPEKDMSVFNQQESIYKENVCLNIPTIVQHIDEIESVVANMVTEALCSAITHLNNDRKKNNNRELSFRNEEERKSPDSLSEVIKSSESYFCAEKKEDWIKVFHFADEIFDDFSKFSTLDQNTDGSFRNSIDAYSVTVNVNNSPSENSECNDDEPLLFDFSKSFSDTPFVNTDHTIQTEDSWVGLFDFSENFFDTEYNDSCLKLYCTEDAGLNDNYLTNE